jgi:hypothetical protein
MLEVGGDLDFLQEALRADRGGQIGAEHLEGNLASMPPVPGEVDAGHAALAQLAIDFVTIGESRAELFQAMLFQQIDH